ncbi:hypothetical protein TURU_015354 [Turdus rufiventris]|nr:hypothetical protein TURU_015354 [Turdus rufiventris]
MELSPAEGGPEPSLNPALAAVIQQCRGHNMPKATIEGALRSVRCPGHTDRSVQGVQASLTTLSRVSRPH